MATNTRKYSGCICKKPIREYSWVKHGRPQTMEQRLELTFTDIDAMHPKMKGQPILVEHDDSVRAVGKITDSYYDTDGAWFVNFELDDPSKNLTSACVLDWLDAKHIQGLSLKHQAQTPYEVSFCWQGAREQTGIKAPSYISVGGGGDVIAASAGAFNMSGLAIRSAAPEATYKSNVPTEYPGSGSGLAPMNFQGPPVAAREPSTQDQVAALQQQILYLQQQAAAAPTMTTAEAVAKNQKDQQLLVANLEAGGTAESLSLLRKAEEATNPEDVLRILPDVMSMVTGKKIMTNEEKDTLVTTLGKMMEHGLNNAAQIKEMRDQFLEANKTNANILKQFTEQYSPAQDKQASADRWGQVERTGDFNPVVRDIIAASRNAIGWKDQMDKSASFMALDHPTVAASASAASVANPWTEKINRYRALLPPAAPAQIRFIPGGGYSVAPIHQQQQSQPAMVAASSLKRSQPPPPHDEHTPHQQQPTGGWVHPDPNVQALFSGAIDTLPASDFSLGRVQQPKKPRLGY